MVWTDFHRKASLESKQQDIVNNLKEGKLVSNHSIKRALGLSGKEYKCDVCGISEWKGITLTLDLDHIDGDSFNNKLDNLRYLCPNCHSITPTFKGRNKNNGKKKVSDEELLIAMSNSPNIRQALIKVGLSPKGGNYVRALRLTAKPA